MKNNSLIGFVGQGWVGKHYADNFQSRGFKIVRYGLERKFIGNKEKIRNSHIVFIAVPTPTTPKGFDDSAVREALSLVGKGKIAIIKSTILPGTAKKLQEKFPDCTIFFSPEFLSESTAKYDVENPFSNIIGMTNDNKKTRALAKEIMEILPPAPFSLICTSTEAELIKYAHNINGYTQIILFNLLYDVASKFGCDWKTIQKAIKTDPMMSSRYTQPVHKKGRGAGGGCFVKDMAAFREIYEDLFPKDSGIGVFKALEKKNVDLLSKSGKDLKIIENVYGIKAPEKTSK